MGLIKKALKSKKKNKKQENNKAVEEFVMLGEKYGVKGLWVLFDEGDITWFKDIPSRHRFVVTGKVQENILEREIESVAFTTSPERREIDKDNGSYIG